jgi:hypothetical protein
MSNVAKMYNLYTHIKAQTSTEPQSERESSDQTQKASQRGVPGQVHSEQRSTASSLGGQRQQRQALQDTEHTASTEHHKGAGDET